jgi:predicted O-methyltransferase YrrM
MTASRQTATTPEQARAAIGGTHGGTGPGRGDELHRFVRENGSTRCLELGFGNGEGSVYIASALEANGCGHLTSVDLPVALERSPNSPELLERAGLSHRVNIVTEPAGYVWWLRRKMREQLRGDTYEPAYDFVFLDGAHTWDVDGLAFALVDRLLAPDGWILFDDLDWDATAPGTHVPEDTRELAHVTEIWELLVATDPRYDELRSDGEWGYAHKSSSPAPPVRTVVKRDLLGHLRDLARGAMLSRRATPAVRSPAPRSAGIRAARRSGRRSACRATRA